MPSNRMEGEYLRLARETGLHKSYVYYVLTGQRNPTLEVADRLATAMHISLGEFSKRVMRARKRREDQKRMAQLIERGAKDRVTS